MKTLFFLVLALIVLTSCNHKTESDSKGIVQDASLKVMNEDKDVVSKVVEFNKPADFIPKGYDLFDEIQGDLNNDTIDDLVLIIKATDKSKIIQDEYRGELDRNRRGIIVLLKKSGNYELLVKNYTCFSSENEDGGVYYAPELYFEILKNKLFVKYAHGRYGYWNYTFRRKDSDLELIGFDSSENQGPMVLWQTSINFLTGKKQTKENINAHNEEYTEEKFKETWVNLKSKKRVLLSEIKDFDEFNLPE